MTKTKAKPPRSKLERAGKGYQQAAKKLDRSKTYGLGEAVSLILESSPVKFDATVEIHIRLGVDQKQPDHNIRGSLILPAGSGKNIRVAVFAEGDEAASAKAAGADFTEIDEVVKMIENERINFDVLIAPPAMMPRLSKYAKVLGPKGLMPNPKSGTVTSNIKAAIAEAKAGKIEFRLDSTGIVHLGIGKVSFGADKILQNAREAINAIRSARPASLKGSYITSVHITTTMGPSLTIKTEEL